MIPQLFWFTATLQVALAIAFALVVRKAPAAHGAALRVRLANGQRKDDWLACGVIWLGMLGDDLPIAALALGCVALAWLSQRTLGRIRLLLLQMQIRRPPR